MNALRNTPNLLIVQRVASAMRDEDAHGWRAQVEEFVTAIGARPQLCHVTDAQWERRFLAGEDPQDAVLAELANVDG